MTLFEYSTVLLAIVIGLGIARLVASLADLVKYRARIEFSAPVSVWHANLLLMHAGWWMVVWLTPVLRTESVSMSRLGSLLFITAVQ